MELRLPGASQRLAAALFTLLVSSPAPELPAPEGKGQCPQTGHGTGSWSSSWSWGYFCHHLAMLSLHCRQLPNRKGMGLA